MADSLVSAPLPKSRAGRAAAPAEPAKVKQLVEALTKNPTIEDEDGDSRPNTLGFGTEFSTQGKAAGAGRKYAKIVATQLDKIVRVNVHDNGKNGNAKKFYWRIYIPLAESTGENGENSENGNSEEEE